MIDVLLAFPPESLIAFVLGALVLNLTPGPDVMFTVACALQGGSRAGALAGLGVGIGVAWHVTLAALGLSALIAAHPGALVAIRWAGAGYLLWLAWKTWTATGALGPGRGVASPWRAVTRGFLSNALNPKPVLFVMAFLPQFTRPEYGPLWQQIVALGAICVILAAVITAGYGLIAGLFGRAFISRMGRLNRWSALLFGGLAVRLAVE